MQDCGFPGGSEDKASACNAGDSGSIPELGRYSGEGNGNPLQYSCQENPMDRGAWRATVHGVAKSQTQLSNSTFFLSFMQGYILSPCLFNIYVEYIMWSAGLDEAQARIKITGRDIIHLRYAGDTTLMVESEEELKSLLMKVKEENEKAGLKLNI